MVDSKTFSRIRRLDPLHSSLRSHIHTNRMLFRGFTFFEAVGSPTTKRGKQEIEPKSRNLHFFSSSPPLHLPRSLTSSIPQIRPKESSHKYDQTMAPSAPSDSTTNSDSHSNGNGVNGDKAAVSSFPTGSTAQPNSESFFDDNADFMNLITPPKFESVEEERKYLKEKLAASLRIFATFRFDHHVVRTMRW